MPRELWSAGATLSSPPQRVSHYLATAVTTAQRLMHAIVVARPAELLRFRWTLLDKRIQTSHYERTYTNTYAPWPSMCTHIFYGPTISETYSPDQRVAKLVPYTTMSIPGSFKPFEPLLYTGWWISRCR